MILDGCDGQDVLETQSLSGWFLVLWKVFLFSVYSGLVGSGRM